MFVCHQWSIQSWNETDVQLKEQLSTFLCELQWAKTGRFVDV